MLTAVDDAVDGSSTGIAMCQIAVFWRTAREEPSMGEVSTIGLDIAKNVFQVHGIDETGTVTVRRQLKRRQVRAFFSKLPSCLVGMDTSDP